MIRKYLSKLESLITWSQSKLTQKQFIFLSSVLVGISSAFAVILLKGFAHWVFSLATTLNGILKLSFINSVLPIVGIMLTVFVVKKTANQQINVSL